MKQATVITEKISQLLMWKLSPERLQRMTDCYHNSDPDINSPWHTPHLAASELQPSRSSTPCASAQNMVSETSDLWGEVGGGGAPNQKQFWVQCISFKRTLNNSAEKSLEWPLWFILKGESVAFSHSSLPAKKNTKTPQVSLPVFMIGLSSHVQAWL